MKNIVFILIACITLCCSKDRELGRSVFIPDENYPGLPKYSELGYNTFGVYIDRITFTSSDQQPLKVLGKEDKVVLIFEGVYRRDAAILTVTVPGIKLTQFEDCMMLHDLQVDLTDPAISVTVALDGKPQEELVIQKGTFHVKRAKPMIVDKELLRVILSGEFSFRTTLNGFPTDFGDGRFDMGVGEINFFKE